MSARDRKLMIALAPLAAFAAYWVLLLNPALDRRAALRQPLAQAQSERDSAIDEAGRVSAARKRYEADYVELVQLSRAIPRNAGVSDLIRELNAAAKGTGIDFGNIRMGSSGAGSKEGDGEQAGGDAEGLDEIPVDLTFSGRFFQLADLFERIQRFVRVADGRLRVSGRLIRIDRFSFDSAAFPEITAQIGATVYSVPADEGATGGATPAGPRGAERGDGGLKPVNNFSTAAVVRP